jgi:hypothetical protein
VHCFLGIAHPQAAAVTTVKKSRLTFLRAQAFGVDDEIAFRQTIEAKIVREKTPVTLERFNSMNAQTRRELSGKNQVIANGSADVDEAGVRWQALNEINKDLLFIRLVDISFSIARSLAFEKMILENAHSILKGVNGAIHCPEATTHR